MRRINLVQKIGRISFILLFVSLLSLIGGAFIMQVTSSSYQLVYQPTTQNNGLDFPDNYLVEGSDSVEQDACCGHIDTTEPAVTLLTPGNTSILLASYTIAFEITDDNPMEDFLADEVLYNWDGGSNTTLESPFNISMHGTDGEHILNLYAVDATENWAAKRYIFTTTSDTDAIVIIGVDLPTTTTTPRRSDGFLLLTTIPVLISAGILFAKRKQ
jgi:hypothetical protein